MSWRSCGPEWNRALLELGLLAIVGVLATLRLWIVLAAILAAGVALVVEVRS